MRAAEDLVEFAKGSYHSAAGFGSLDRFGRIDRRLEIRTFMTARMTYVFSLASLLEFEDVDRFAAHGISSLAGPFRDRAEGGFFAGVGESKAAGRKRAYDHCFVALAASAAAAAGVDGAQLLLDEVAEDLDTHFWSESESALVESWDSGFRHPEPYWGANSNMHGVESMLALYGHTKERRWLDRAVSIAENFIDRRARARGWRLPEHFDSDWNVLLDYNKDEPKHEFRPYGMTVGHLFEWSRLLVELNAATGNSVGWIPGASEALYSLAALRGWAVDGEPGFIYTTDWAGNPVVTQRPHWVCAEAISAASTLHRLTGEPRFREDLDTWQAYAAAFLHDPVHGSWHHELDPSNRPATSMWSGKPDIYHAFQASILPQLPIAESVAGRIIAHRGR